MRWIAELLIRLERSADRGSTGSQIGAGVEGSDFSRPWSHLPLPTLRRPLVYGPVGRIRGGSVRALEARWDWARQRAAALSGSGAGCPFLPHL